MNGALSCPFLWNPMECSSPGSFVFGILPSFSPSLTPLLEKTPESPLDSKEIQPVNPKGNQPWLLTGRTDAEAKVPIFWLPGRRADSLEKTLTLGKIGGRRRRGWQRMRWLDGVTDSTDMSCEQTPPGAGDEQGSLACCSPRGRKESDMTEWLNYNDNVRNRPYHFFSIVVKSFCK